MNITRFRQISTALELLDYLCCFPQGIGLFSGSGNHMLKCGKTSPYKLEIIGESIQTVPLIST